MPVELIKEYVQLNRVVLMTESQSIFESDILVPDIKPDITEILVIDAFPSVESVENFRDKLSINVSVLYKILYKCEDEQKSVRSINFTAKYNTSINVDGMSNDSTSSIKCDLEHVDYNLLNERKVNAKVILKFNIQVVNSIEKGLACDLEADSEMQMKNKTYNVSNCIYSTKEGISIDESLALPGVKSSIDEILRTDAIILGSSVRLIDNQLVIKGDLNITTLFIAEDVENSLQYVENTIPFIETLNVADMSDDTILETDISLDSFSATIAEDADGENRCLDVEATIIAVISCYENKAVDIIDDVYALNAKLQIERESCNVLEYLGENQNQFVLKEVVQKPSELPDVSEIISVICKPGVSSWEIDNNQIIVDGFVENNILYLSSNTNSPVTCFTQEIPYKHMFDLRDIYNNINIDDLKITIKSDIEHINYSIISIEELELRIVVNVSVSMGKIIEIPAIASISEDPIDVEVIRSRPSLIIYFIKPDDTLWEIAKKFYTTEETLVKTNNLSGDNDLIPGQQLLIPKIAFS